MATTLPKIILDDEEEKKTHLAQRYANTNTTFFKVLLCLIFGATGLAQLYVIYLA